MAKDSSNKVVNVPPLRFPEFTGTWEMCTLKNIIRIQGGYAFQSDKFQSDGIPIIRISNLPQLSNIVDLSDCVYYEDGNYENYIVAYGDLLIAMSGATTGKTAVYLENTKAFLNQRVGLFRAKSPKLYYSFLYPFIESNIFINQLHEKLVAGAQPNISSKDIEEIKLYLPAPLEQQKIALFFAAIDERIATQSKIIEDLEQLRSAIYHRVFSTIKGRTVALQSIANIVKGKQLNGTELSDNGDYYVMNGGIVPSGYYHEYNTPANTISISEGGNSCGYVQFNYTPFWSGGLHHIALEEVNLQFLYHFLKYREKDIMALRIGSGLPNIQKKDLGNFPILLPDIYEQNKVVCLFETLQQKVDAETKVQKYLFAQKQYFLQQMFI